MASLFFTCPTTHQQAPTGIETDVQSLRAAWKATLKVKCPHCGEVHEISVRETYINGALDGASDRLRGAARGAGIAPKCDGRHILTIGNVRLLSARRAGRPQFPPESPRAVLKYAK